MALLPITCGTPLAPAYEPRRSESARRGSVQRFSVPPEFSPMQKHLCAGKNIAREVSPQPRTSCLKPNSCLDAWVDRARKSFCDCNWVTWTGPAASAKSFNASLFGLEYWLEYPEGTSVIMASTTKDALSRRLLYFVQDLHSKIQPRRRSSTSPLQDYLTRPESARKSGPRSSSRSQR